MDQIAKVVKVKKNTDGTITDVMLQNGNILNIDDAILMAREGSLEGVNVGMAKNGREFLRANPNGVTIDNLDNLPTF